MDQAMLPTMPSRLATGSARLTVLRWVSSIGAFIPTITAYAQEDGGARIPPSETVSVVYVIVFAILFFGMILGFFWYLWMNEHKRKSGADGTRGTRRGAT